MRLLDSHLHLWDLDLMEYPRLEGPLAFHFGALELSLAAVDDATEEASVFIHSGCVEAQYLDEVRWVAGFAADAGVKAIVAGARLDKWAETDAHLSELEKCGLVVGVRHLLRDEPDGLARSSAFLAGAREVAARGWSFDAGIRPSQLSDVADLARAVPDLRIVLEHLGSPEAGNASAPVVPSPEWTQQLAAVAAHPNVFCKLSGLPAAAGGDWTQEQFEPFLDVALEAFGAERLIWGSDWPVSVIGPAEEGDPYAPEDGSPTYQASARTRWARTVEAWATHRRLDTDAIMWRNAFGFYRLDQVRPQRRLPDVDEPVRRKRWYERLWG